MRGLHQRVRDAKKSLRGDRGNFAIIQDDEYKKGSPMAQEYMTC